MAGVMMEGPEMEQEAPMEQGAPQAPVEGQEAGPVEEKVSEELKSKITAYVEGLSKLLHSKETKESVYGMLQSGDPMQTIPKTALAINEQMETSFKKKGREVDLDVLVKGAEFLVTDIVKIGEAGGFFDIDEEDPAVIGTLLTNTMQPWIEAKIKEDPDFAIELQARVEPMMSEEAKAKAGAYGAEKGLTPNAGVSQAMQVTRRQGVLEGQAAANKQANGMRQGGQPNV